MISRRPRIIFLAISAAGLLTAGCGSNSVGGSLNEPTSGNSTGPTAGHSASASGSASPDPSLGQSAGTTTDAASGGSVAGTAAPVNCTYVPTGNAARPVGLPAATPLSPSTLTLALRVAGKPTGSIQIKLDSASAPCTVGSIAHLAKAKFYDATRCHRLTTSGIYVLQCGDPTATGTGGPGYSFPDELSGQETYPAGTVAMANNGQDTNGSQFFLVYKLSQLPPEYTVFGTITGGTSVLDAIAAAGTAQPAGDGTPKEPVVITTATVS